MTTIARGLFGSPGGRGAQSTANRIWEVGKASWMYPSVADAVTAINADPSPPTTTNRAIIWVHPGKYTSTTPTVIPAYTGVKGDSKYLVQFQNDVGTLFQAGGSNVFFEDFLVEGSPTAGIYAFDGNNQNAVHIRNVDMLDNGLTARQRFLIQEGATWSILTIDQCVVNYRGLDEFACRLTNSGAAARFVDVWVQYSFFDAFQLTNFGGSFDLRGLQDIRFWYTTIRGTNAPGAASFFNTGIRHRLGGVTGTPTVEIAHGTMSGVLAGSGGVACFGDAGTAIIIDNSLARGAGSSGTLTVRNSFITQ